MARPHVPQFGKWEADGNNIPYTVVFDKARQGRGNKMINPNDPQQNPTAFAHPTPPTKPQTTQPDPVRHKPIQENGQLRQTPVVDHNRRSSSRTSIVSEHSIDRIDRSPLHQYQPKVTGRGNVSSNANRTPGRARTKDTNDDLHGGVTVPPFGGWDEKNPDAGAGLTKIFDNLSYEKRTGTPNITTETHDYRRDRSEQSSNSHVKAKSRCWPWFR